jgi:hypothetical protein
MLRQMVPLQLMERADQEWLCLCSAAGLVLELRCGERQVGPAGAPGTRPQRRCRAPAPRGEGRLLHLGRDRRSCASTSCATLLCAGMKHV